MTAQTFRMTNPVENKAILAISIFYSNLERTRVVSESPSAAHQASPRAGPGSPRRPARCLMTVAVQSAAFPPPWNACSEDAEMTPGRPVPATCNPGRPAGYQRPPEPSRRGTAHWPQAISAGGCAPSPLAPALPRLSEKPSLASGTAARLRAFAPLQAWGPGWRGCALRARAEWGRPGVQRCSGGRPGARGGREGGWGRPRGSPPGQTRFAQNSAGEAAPAAQASKLRSRGEGGGAAARGTCRRQSGVTASRAPGQCGVGVGAPQTCRTEGRAGPRLGREPAWGWA